MKLVAVSTMLHEAAIAPYSVTHLLGEGVDHVIVSVGEGDTDTRDSLAFLRDVTVIDQTGPLDQGLEMTRLAYLAADLAADWVIPFDADEAWIDPLGSTVRQILEGLPESCLKVHTAVFKHATTDLKYTAQNPLGKVAFRPDSEMVVAWGNHDVYLGRAGDEEHGLLEIRELQYRDYAHFLAKVEKARVLFESWDIPEQHGNHMRSLVAMNSVELAQEYARLRSGDTVLDPIPFKGMVQL